MGSGALGPGRRRPLVSRSHSHLPNRLSSAMRSTAGLWLVLSLALTAVADETDSGYAVSLAVNNPRAHTDTDVKVRIQDAAGLPLTGAGVNGWFNVHPPNTPPLDRDKCVQRIATYTAGGLFRQPAVDLNVYHVVVLNEDATLSVLDPKFSFGGTRLLAMVQLPSSGTDWVLTRDGRHLFVAMPEAGQVAVVDTVEWKVATNLETGRGSNRLLMQPDEGYIWVASDDGVAAIDPSKKKIAKRIVTAAGPHDLALSSDQRTLFVTNAGAGTTSVIDVHAMRVVRTIATGTRPVSVAWSSLANAAYVISERDGAVFALDAKQSKPRATIQSVIGTTRIRFAPGGRLGFIVNPGKNSVYILDTVVNKVVQTAVVESKPFEVTFSESLAYVRHLESETVLMIPLGVAGTPGAQVTVADFPGGQRGFGATGVAPIAADGIVGTPGGDAVLVTNPSDKQIYFYKQGMAAPMGSLSAYSHVPRATLVIDRTLRETKPGHYETVAKMPKPGLYDVAVFVDSPRIVTCFQVKVEEPAKALPAP